MKRNTRIRLSLWLGLCLAALPATVQAHGFRLPDQDAQATARGEAFAATADNPSAIYYNPAGITQLPGDNLRLGVYGISLRESYDSGTLSRDTKESLHAVPQAFFTHSFDTLPLTAGLGLYAPYGLGTEWPEDTGFRSIALQSDMSYMTLEPVIAWRVLTNLSIAIGPTFNYSEIKLQQGVTPYPGNDRSILKGDGVAYGFSAGLLWQPHPKLSLGLAYRSKTEVDYDGHTELSFVVPPPGYPPYLKMDAKATLPFPQNIVAGISYRPTPDWNFEFDIDWTDWNPVNTVQVQQMIPTALMLNYQSSFYYEFGVTRNIGKGWHVSAGYIFNENSVPDATFNPLVPDQDRHFLSAGVGYRGEHLGFDVAYQFGFSGTRTVTGSPRNPPAYQSADGEYEYLSHAFSVSLGWRF